MASYLKFLILNCLEGATPVNAMAETARAAILTTLSFSLFLDSSSKILQKKQYLDLFHDLYSISLESLFNQFLLPNLQMYRSYFVQVGQGFQMGIWADVFYNFFDIRSQCIQHYMSEPFSEIQFMFVYTYVVHKRDNNSIRTPMFIQLIFEQFRRPIILVFCNIGKTVGKMRCRQNEMSEKRDKKCIIFPTEIVSERDVGKMRPPQNLPCVTYKLFQ